jgi:hypothetical protein
MKLYFISIQPRIGCQGFSERFLKNSLFAVQALRARFPNFSRSLRAFLKARAYPTFPHGEDFVFQREGLYNSLTLSVQPDRNEHMIGKMVPVDSQRAAVEGGCEMAEGITRKEADNGL